MITELLACITISDNARAALLGAGCIIHKKVPGLDSDVLIVELKYQKKSDRRGMYAWDTPREIEIESLGLHLHYIYLMDRAGYHLSVLYGESENPAIAALEYDELLEEIPNE